MQIHTWVHSHTLCSERSGNGFVYNEEQPRTTTYLLHPGPLYPNLEAPCAFILQSDSTCQRRKRSDAIPQWVKQPRQGQSASLLLSLAGSCCTTGQFTLCDHGGPLL